MAHAHPIIDADVRFVIDPVTRTVTNMSKKSVLMQYDHNSERFTFALPQFVEGHDMMLCNRVEIHYINVSGKSKEKHSGVYEVRDMQPVKADDNSELVTFTWLVSENATAYAGSLSFLVLFACVEDGESLYRWSTGINTSIIISQGMDNSEDIEEVLLPDILAQWKYDLFEKNFAYETALEYGFEGTELDWLNSFKGVKGDTGLYVGAKEPSEAPYFWFDTSKYDTSGTVYVDTEEQAYTLQGATLDTIVTVQESKYDYTIK